MGMQKEFDGLCEYSNLEWLRNLNSLGSTTDVKECNGKSTKPMNNNSHLYGDAIGYVNHSLADKFKKQVFENYINYADHSSEIMRKIENSLKTKLDSRVIAIIAYHKVSNSECAKLTANDWIERFGLGVTKQAFVKSWGLGVVKRNFNKTWLPIINRCESVITVALMEADMHCGEYRKFIRQYENNEF